MFGLNTLQLGAVALAAAFFISGVSYLKGRSDGADLATTRTLQATIDQLQERSETDAEIRNLNDVDLCRLLGGRVSDTGQCE